MDIEFPIKPANSDKAFNTQRSTPMKTRSQANKTKSIVEAVKWGRNIYDSIRKFLQF